MTSRKLKIGSQVSITRKVTERDLEVFADLSQDRNPIHFSEEFASKTVIGRRIAHGMISAALISGALTELMGPGNIWISANLNFEKPVFIGDEITCTLTVSEVTRRSLFEIEVRILSNDSDQVVSGNVKSMRSA